MSDKIKVTETHTRVHEVRFSRHQVSAIIGDEAARRAGVAIQGGPNANYVVQIVDETEGSPPYRVGVRATVIITENLAEPSPPALPPNTPEVPRTLSAGQIRTALKAAADQQLIYVRLVDGSFFSVRAIDYQSVEDGPHLLTMALEPTPWGA